MVAWGEGSAVVTSWATGTPDEIWTLPAGQSHSTRVEEQPAGAIEPTHRTSGRRKRQRMGLLSEDEVHQEALVTLQESLRKSPGSQARAVAGVELAAAPLAAQDLHGGDDAMAVDLQRGADASERAPVGIAQAIAEIAGPGLRERAQRFAPVLFGGRALGGQRVQRQWVGDLFRGQMGGVRGRRGRVGAARNCRRALRSLGDYRWRRGWRRCLPAPGEPTNDGAGDQQRRDAQRRGLRTRCAAAAGRPFLSQGGSGAFGPPLGGMVRLRAYGGPRKPPTPELPLPV